MRRRPDQPVLLTSSLLLACVLLAGCSGSGDGGDKDAEPQQDKGFSVSADTGKVTGKLSGPAAGQASEAVAGVVEDWLAAAYVDGPWVENADVELWPGFTDGARNLARRDSGMTSNSRLAEKVDGVDVQKATVTVDLLGVKGKAQGATARVRLVFTAAGDVDQRTEVGGRVTLTRVKEDGAMVWRIFAYDLHRGSTAIGEREEK